MTISKYSKCPHCNEPILQVPYEYFEHTRYHCTVWRGDNNAHQQKIQQALKNTQRKINPKAEYRVSGAAEILRQVIERRDERKMEIIKANEILNQE